MSLTSELSTDFDNYKAAVDKAVQDLVDQVQGLKGQVEDPAEVQALEDKIAAAQAAVQASDPGAAAPATSAAPAVDAAPAAPSDAPVETTTTAPDATVDPTAS